jgi:transposase InsO family protein
MDKGRFLVETHLRTGRPIGELAAAHGVHRSWLYKRLARYRREGEAGLELRSRSPKSTPTKYSSDVEDAVVRLRKELVDLGMDAGAATIQVHLAKELDAVPSVPTIWRMLKARGFVTPQPHKRPRSSWVRFEADLPNECWQADVTHVVAANDVVFEVLNIIDDHSRVCVASRAFVTTRSPDVVRSLHGAASQWGYPQSFLTDNGAIFTASKVKGLGAMEAELLSLGITSKHGKPYHPQTQGKIERFHQTLKKFLGQQDPATSKKQLQRQLDFFVEYYNSTRPHRALNRRTPLEAFNAREKAVPTGPKIDASGYRIRHDKVDISGCVTVRHRGKLHHIGLGRPYSGWRVIMLINGLDIRILGLDGSPLRHLTLDETKDYQPQA